MSDHASALSPSDVGVVVLNYHGLDDTLRCLASLRASDPAPGFVVVVDNAPNAGELEAIRAAFPEVEGLASPRNLGFAGGCNLGIERALERGARAVWLVNNDAVVEPGCLGALCEALCDPTIGVATGKILFDTGGCALQDQSASPSRIWAAGGRVVPRLGMGVNVGEGEVDRGCFDVPCDVDFASGCLMLIRRSVLERVGGFDPCWFLYLEDVDLCLRVRAAGFRIRYVPKARAWHRVHGTTGAGEQGDSDMLTYYLTRNRVLFAKRYLPPLSRWVCLARLVVTRALKIGASLLRGNPGRAAVIVEALLDGVRARGGMWRRQQLEQEKKSR